MSDFQPGEGWREIDVNTRHTGKDMIAFYPRGEQENRAWVREDPVPPLPTAPYTVIRPNFKDQELTTGWPEAMLLGSDGNWRASGWFRTAPNLAREITGFEVLAEPLAVTAKAVLDRIASEPWAREVDLSKWRSEFGVES